MNWQKACCGLVIALLFGCLPETRDNPDGVVNLALIDYPYIIDIPKALESNSHLNLSELGDNISYIPLNGMPEIAISWIVDIELANNDIFMQASHGVGILRYSYSGKFINRIGRLGNGPGEISRGSTFSVSHEEKMVYVHRNFSHDEYKFSFEGQFTDYQYKDRKKIHTSTIAISANRILRLGIRPYPPEIIPEGLYEAALFDEKNRLLYSVPTGLTYNEEWRSSPMKAKRFRIRQNNVWIDYHYLFKAWSSDTIYEASQKRIVPKYVFDKGPFCSQDRTVVMNEKNSISPPNNIIETEALYESQRHLVWRSWFKGNTFVTMMNKRTKAYSTEKFIGNVFSLVHDEKIICNINNDLDGGISFYPQFTNRSGDQWVYSITALDYIEEMDELAAKGKIDLNNIENEAVKTYQALSPEDNPVIVILDLKK